MTVLFEESDPFCISPAEAADLLAGAPWRRFAVIGDSLSAGTGGPTPGYASLGWSDRVADVLRRVHPDLAYLNIAEIGATTAEILARQGDRMVGFRPDLVHVPSGANDLFRRVPDFVAIEKGLRQVFDLAAGTGALLSTFAFGRAFDVPGHSDWPQRLHKLNAIVRRLAAEYDAVLVDMWDHPINFRPNLLSEDRIHFSSSGQAVVAAEYVKKLATRIGTEVGSKAQAAS